MEVRFFVLTTVIMKKTHPTARIDLGSYRTHSTFSFCISPQNTIEDCGGFPVCGVFLVEPQMVGHRKLEQVHYCGGIRNKEKRTKFL